MIATSPGPPAIPGPTPETRGKLVQASGSLMPIPLRTAPIVQKSAPRRHEITDPRIQAKGRSRRCRVTRERSIRLRKTRVATSVTLPPSRSRWSRRLWRLGGCCHASEMPCRTTTLSAPFHRDALRHSAFRALVCLWYRSQSPRFRGLNSDRGGVGHGVPRRPSRRAAHLRHTGVGGFARLRRSERSVFTPAAARSPTAAPATGIVTGGLLQLHLGLIRSTKNEEMRDETEETRR